MQNKQAHLNLFRSFGTLNTGFSDTLWNEFKFAGFSPAHKFDSSATCSSTKIAKELTYRMLICYGIPLLGRQATVD